MARERKFQPKRIAAFLTIAVFLLLCAHSAGLATTWEHSGLGGGGYFSNVKIDPDDPNKIYVGSDVTGLFRTTDGGDHWDAATRGLGSYHVGEILLAPPVDLGYPKTILVSTRAGVYRSTDGGATFANVLSSGGQAFYALALDPINSQIVYAAEGFFVHAGVTPYAVAEIHRSTALGASGSWQDLGPEQIFRNCAIHSVVPLEPDTDPTHPGADALIVSASGSVGVKKGVWTGSSWSWTSINGSSGPGGTGLPHHDVRDLEATYSGGQLSRLYVVLDSKWNCFDHNPPDPTHNPSSIYDRDAGYGGGVWISENQGVTWYPTSVSSDHFLDSDGYYVKRMRNLAINQTNGNLNVALNAARWMDQGIWRGNEGIAGWAWQKLTEARIYNPDGSPYGTPDPNFNFELTYQTVLAGCEGLDIHQASGSLAFTSSMHTWLCEGGNCLPGACPNGDCEMATGEYWHSLDTSKVSGQLLWVTTGMDDTQAWEISVNPLNSAHWYMGLGDVGLIRSTDSGVSWGLCPAVDPYADPDYVGTRNCWKVFPIPGSPTNQWLGVFGYWWSPRFDVWVTTGAPTPTSDWDKVPFSPDINTGINDVLIVGNMMAVATNNGVYKSQASNGVWTTQTPLTPWMNGVTGSPVASKVVADPAGSGPNRKFVAAFQRTDTQSGGIYYANKYGITWQPASYSCTPPPSDCADCWDSIYSLEWSTSSSHVVYAGSGNPKGCFLKSTNKGVNWTYITDTFGTYSSGCVSVVDLVETTSVPPALYAALRPPLTYPACLEPTFGGVFVWNDPIWSSFSTDLDAGHMTFLKQDGTYPGRLFAGTMGNGAYVWDPAQSRGGDLPSTGSAEAVPVESSLQHLIPTGNPASASATLRFALSQACPVSISIYDPSGRKLRQLLEEDARAEGVHSVTWDGRDDGGERVPSGVYYVRVSTPRDLKTVKVVLMK